MRDVILKHIPQDTFLTTPVTGYHFLFDPIWLFHKNCTKLSQTPGPTVRNRNPNTDSAGAESPPSRIKPWEEKNSVLVLLLSQLFNFTS